MKEGNYSPLKVSIIVIVGALLFIVIGILDEARNDIDKELICTTHLEYDETLSFYFVNDKMFSYNHEEYFEFKSKTDLEKWVKHFEEEKAKLKLDDYFKYEIETKDFTLTVKTFIDIANRSDFFNSYISSLNINYQNSIKDVKKTLENKKYECKVK